MPIATIHKLSSGGDLYHIHFVDQRTDPGFGHPEGGHRPDQGLPGSGGRPEQGLPGSRPGIPSNELPDSPPPQLAPGYTLVLIRTDGKWNYAAIAPGSPPPRPLPGPPPHGPGPGQPNLPNQGLPGGPPPTGPGSPNYPTGQPVPPTGTPV